MSECSGVLMSQILHQEEELKAGFGGIFFFCCVIFLAVRTRSSMCTPPHRRCYHVSTLFDVAQVTAGGDFESVTCKAVGTVALQQNSKHLLWIQKKKVKPLHYLAIFLKVKQ